MRVLLQRVREARVEVAGEIVGAIGPGLLLLVGFTHGDTEAHGSRLAEKIVKLRIFNDDKGKMNRSVLDVGGDILAVSQFTLYADCTGGNRPSFSNAARPEQAEPSFRAFVAALESRLGRNVPTGRFGADMQVQLINDGPVTFMLDTEAR